MTSSVSGLEVAPFCSPDELLDCFRFDFLERGRVEKKKSFNFILATCEDHVIWRRNKQISFKTRGLTGNIQNYFPEILKRAYNVQFYFAIIRLIDLDITLDPWIRTGNATRTNYLQMYKWEDDKEDEDDYCDGG